jgi:DNA (cytosine-5)-methyltransferase 1
VSLTHLSLFSGIGGIDLAAHWAGFQTVAFCEQNKFCQQVLGKHWPGVPIYDDVRTLSSKSLGPGRIDLISGGFPCQDLSIAGKRFGIEGTRSGLWSEFARLIGEIRPKYVLVENVAALLDRGMGRVLGDLAALGYDAEWEVISACSAGAPHMRERLFIVAYPNTGTRKQCGWFRRSPVSDKERDLYFWPNKPQPIRVVDGIPDRLDRKNAIGNSVMPQIVYPILKAIADYEMGAAA